MTDLYLFAGTGTDKVPAKMGLTTCVPIEKKEGGQVVFGGALCADVAPMGQLSKYYNFASGETENDEENKGNYMIYSEGEEGRHHNNKQKYKDSKEWTTHNLKFFINDLIFEKNGYEIA
jgi:hypothetical protein